MSPSIAWIGSLKRSSAGGRDIVTDGRSPSAGQGALGMPLSDKSSRSKQNLKEAAREVFRRDGYLRARIADITAEAGCSPGSFYTYFENKQSLLWELLEDFWEEVNERTLVPFRRRLPAQDASREAIRAFWFGYKEYLPEMTALFQASMVEPEFRDEWLRIRNRGIASIRRGLAAAQAKGYSPGVDPDLAAPALSAMLELSCHTWLNGVGVAPPSDEAAISALWSLWHHAVYWKE